VSQALSETSRDGIVRYGDNRDFRGLVLEKRSVGIDDVNDIRIAADYLRSQCGCV
jgi:hypothetical protein